MKPSRSQKNNKPWPRGSRRGRRRPRRGGGRGRGSAWTTVHLHRENETADLLGIPYEEYTQAGIFPVAYTIGSEFRRALREPASSVLHWNQW